MERRGTPWNTIERRGTPRNAEERRGTPATRGHGAAVRERLAGGARASPPASSPAPGGLWRAGWPCSSFCRGPGAARRAGQVRGRLGAARSAGLPGRRRLPEGPAGQVRLGCGEPGNRTGHPLKGQFLHPSAKARGLARERARVTSAHLPHLRPGPLAGWTLTAGGALMVDIAAPGFWSTA